MPTAARSLPQQAAGRTSDVQRRGRRDRADASRLLELAEGFHRLGFPAKRSRGLLLFANAIAGSGGVPPREISELVAVVWGIRPPRTRHKAGERLLTNAQLRERVQRMRSPKLPMADRFARTRELLAATDYPPPYEPGAQRQKDGPWWDER